MNMQLRPAVFALLITLPGCSFSGGVSGSSMSGQSWSDGSANPRPGISEGDVNVVSLSDFDGSKATVTFWADRSGGFSGSRSSSGTSNSEFQMSVRDPSGKSVDVALTMSDGQAFSLIIGEEAYSLADGTLFLFKTSGGELEVLQLSVEDGWNDSDDYPQIAEDTREIREFFVGAAATDRDVDSSAAPSTSDETGPVGSADN